MEESNEGLICEVILQFILRHRTNEWNDSITRRHQILVLNYVINNGIEIEDDSQKNMAKPLKEYIEEVYEPGIIAADTNIKEIISWILIDFLLNESEYINGSKNYICIKLDSDIQDKKRILCDYINTYGNDEQKCMISILSEMIEITNNI